MRLPSDRVRLSATWWILIRMVSGPVWLLPYAMFFFLMTAAILAPKPSRIFWRLLLIGIFPLEWRIAGVTPFFKGPLLALDLELSADVDYVCYVQGFWKADRFALWSLLGEIWCAVISPIQHALLDIGITGQMKLDRGGELVLVQIDFIGAFDRVNHGGIVFKLQEAGVGGMILKVFWKFLSNRTHRVKIDSACSSSTDVVFGVPQGSFLGPLLFLLCIADLPVLLQNVLLVILTTLPCFVEYHILLLGLLWQLP